MATQKRGGVEVDGLAESIKALGRVSPLLKKEAVNVLRTGAKQIQAESQGRIGNHPSYRLPTNRGMIGRSATGTGAAVVLRATKYPWALAGEMGERVAHVPRRKGASRPKQQRGFRRRTAAPHKPPTSSDMFKNRGGYWIQPTLRKRLPVVSNDMQKEMLKVFQKAMKQAGVKSHG